MEKLVGDIVQVFTDCGLGLQLTHQLPQENQLQFFVIRFEVKPDHMRCWMCSPHSEKPLLNFNFAFSDQLQRLKDAGFPGDIIRLKRWAHAQCMTIEHRRRRNFPQYFHMPIDCPTV